MLALVRLIVADRRDLDVLIAQSGHNNASRSRSFTLRDMQYGQNLRNEIRAMTLLHSMCGDYLSRYAHSYEEDVRRLESNELEPFSNARHAVIQLKGEKEVLKFLQDFASTSLELLQCSSDSVYSSSIGAYRITKHPVILRYCQNVVTSLRHDEQRLLDNLQRNADLSRPTIV